MSQLPLARVREHLSDPFFFLGYLGGRRLKKNWRCLAFKFVRWSHHRASVRFRLCEKKKKKTALGADPADLKPTCYLNQ